MDIGTLIVNALAVLAALITVHESAQPWREQLAQSKIRRATARIRDPLKTGGAQLNRILGLPLARQTKREVVKAIRDLLAVLEKERLSEAHRRQAVDKAKKRICCCASKDKAREPWITTNKETRKTMALRPVSL
jgi:hypothetical protein